MPTTDDVVRSRQDGGHGAKCAPLPTLRSCVRGTKTEKGRPVCTERPFLSHGSPTSAGDFGPLHRGPMSQPRPTRGPLQIGAVATGTRTDTMVSHLRKMQRLKRDVGAGTRMRRKVSPLLTGADCRKFGCGWAKPAGRANARARWRAHHQQSPRVQDRWWARRKSAFAHPTLLQFGIARLEDGTFALSVTPRSRL